MSLVVPESLSLQLEQADDVSAVASPHIATATADICQTDAM
jgi:hypothetical protein